MRVPWSTSSVSSVGTFLLFFAAISRLPIRLPSATSVPPHGGRLSRNLYRCATIGGWEVLVPTPGLGPGTFRLGGERSIRLSYVGLVGALGVEPSCESPRTLRL